MVSIGYLEHLDEGNTQIEIGLVATDQTEGEEEADGDDGAEVDAAGHLDLLATIEQAGGPGEDLGHERGKGQMPCCQDDGCRVWLEVSLMEY